MKFEDSQVPKCEGYFDFAQYRLWGTRRFVVRSIPPIRKEREWMGHSAPGVLAGSEGGFAALVVADADGFVDAADEDFAVTDAACAGRTEDGFDSLVFDFILDDHLDLDFGQQIDGIFIAAIELRVALLAAMSARLQDGHAFNACLEQRFFDRIQPGRLKNSFYFEHMQIPRMTA